MGENDNVAVRELYQQLIASWNQADATSFAEGFTEDASVIGFDGSQMNGRKQILKEISSIFADHRVASYVTIVEEVRQLENNCFLLRAAVGMVPPGSSDLKEERNAIQSLVAIRKNDRIQIALFHNTPAVFDGRPELGKALTERLRSKLKK